MSPFSTLARTLRPLGLCLLATHLAACSGGRVKEKLTDKPFVKLTLSATPLKKVFTTRWVEPEPVMLRFLLTNRSETICDVLNRFIPAMPTEPAMISPLAMRVVQNATGRDIPLERFDDPDRPLKTDFVTLEARYALTADVNIKEYFPSMREPGAYTVSLGYQFGDKEADALKGDSEFKKIVPWTGTLEAAPVTVLLVGVPEPTPTPTPKPTPTPPPKPHGEKEGHEAKHEEKKEGHGGAPAAGHGEATPPPKVTGNGTLIIPPPTPEPTPEPTPVPTPEPSAAGHGGHGGHG